MLGMPDRRKHRGANPQDQRLFADGRLADLRSAAADLAWLLSRGYAPPSSVKLVGDRHALTARQRTAVQRATCDDQALERRLIAMLPVSAIAGHEVAIDGYNLLITIEAAMAGGVILAGRDGTFRDLASVHGSYRSMDETLPALKLIGRALTELGASGVWWALDAPVSNSGRLRQRMLRLAARHGWNWSVELLANPDKALIADERPVITSDSVILDGCTAWVNLARHIVETYIQDAWIVDAS